MSEIGDKSNTSLERGLPVVTLQEKVADMYQQFGLAFPKSRVSRMEGEPQPRMPLTRVERALEYKKINIYRRLRDVARYFNTSVESFRPHSTIEYFHDLDAFDQQFQILEERKVDLGDLGSMPLFYSRVQIERHRDKQGENPAPVFVIPAWAGDIYGVEPVVRELALEGNEVFTLPAPEAFLGSTTEEFAQAVEQSPISPDDVSYEPHTRYYQKAIEQICKERNIPKGHIRLVAYSTGGPITMELLSKPDFSAEDALILAPASSVKQSLASFAAGVIPEVPSLLPLSRNPINSAFTHSREDMDPEELQRRKRIADVQLKKVLCKSQAYKTARVKAGRKIIVEAGVLDLMTKSNSILPELLENQQIVTVKALRMSHLGPLYQAREFISEMEKLRKDKTDVTKRTYTYVRGKLSTEA